MKAFLFTYWFHGKKYGFEIPAKDEAEAWWRLEMMQKAEIVGTKVLEIKL